MLCQLTGSVSWNPPSRARQLLQKPRLVVKYVEAHVVAFLQRCGAREVGFEWIHLLPLCVVVQ